MGKGLALAFKKQYPEMFTRYHQLCEDNQFSIGQLWLYKSRDKWILNFPTKQDWRQKSNLVDIEAGLNKFVMTYEQRMIQSISFPQLGSGNGGLDWEKEVRPLMERYLDRIPIDVQVHMYR